MFWNFKKWLLNNILILSVVFLIISPVVSSLIIRINWMFLTLMGLTESIVFAEFYKSTANGTYAIIAALVTVIWYFVNIKIKNAKQVVYIIDQILSELKYNYGLFDLIIERKADLNEKQFQLKQWEKIGENATLLPRDIYTPLQLLYKYFEKSNRCKTLKYTSIEIETTKGTIKKLYKERRDLRFWYEVRQTTENKKDSRYFFKTAKKAKHKIKDSQ